MAKKRFEWVLSFATNLGRYKKLVPAMIGIALLITLKYLDIDLPGFSAVVLDWLVGGATVFGVYQVKNEPTKSTVDITTTVETTQPKGTK